MLSLNRDTSSTGEMTDARPIFFRKSGEWFIPRISGTQEIPISLGISCFSAPRDFLSSPFFEGQIRSSVGKSGITFSARIVIGSFYASPNVYGGGMRVVDVPGAIFGAGCRVHHREPTTSLHTFTSLFGGVSGSGRSTARCMRFVWSRRKSHTPYSQYFMGLMRSGTTLSREVIAPAMATCCYL